MFIQLSIQMTYLREDVHVPTTSHLPRLYTSFRAIIMPANPVQDPPNQASKPQAYAMSPKDMQPGPQVQFRNTPSLASNEEPTQVQPLQSILKEPMYSKNVTFGESLSKSPQEQTNKNMSTPSQLDLPKTPTDKAQENLPKCHLQYGHMTFSILV